LKENANEEELTKAKENAKSSGGEIKHEFSLIKGFTCVPPPATSTSAVADWFCRVEFPDDKVGILQTNDHIHVEQDGEVMTQ
jgi:hypothetical protein